MSGFGALITFETGSLEKANAVLRRLRICTVGESLGGVETLVSHPATMTHAALGEEGRAKIGLTDGMVRISAVLRMPMICSKIWSRRSACCEHGVLLRQSGMSAQSLRRYRSPPNHSFALTDEQEQLRKEIRDFAAREIAPNVMRWDEASEFPHEVVQKLGEMGLMGVIFPVELGGAGLGYVDYALAVEELSAVDGSIGIIVASHNSLCTNHIFVAGNEEQKRKYIPLLASGKWLGAWGLTEPGSGSDAGSARTTAVRKGDRWVLNGNKTFITNGHYADVSVIIAVTDKSQGTRGLSAFVVEKGTPGFRAGKKENKLGLRASDTSELIFEDCEIPAKICWARRARALSTPCAFWTVAAFRLPRFRWASGAGPLTPRAAM